jgi:hypothetical protein
MSLRQYSRSWRRDIDSTIHNVSEFDVMKLTNSFTKTAKSKATLLPCLYKTIGPELPQKSVIVVHGYRANADGALVSMIPSNGLSKWNFL